MKKIFFCLILTLVSSVSFADDISESDLSDIILKTYLETSNSRISNSSNQVLPPYDADYAIELKIKRDLISHNIPQPYKKMKAIIGILSETVDVTVVEPETGISHTVTRQHTLQEYKDLVNEVLSSYPRL